MCSMRIGANLSLYFGDLIALPKHSPASTLSRTRTIYVIPFLEALFTFSQTSRFVHAESKLAHSGFKPHTKRAIGLGIRILP